MRLPKNILAPTDFSPLSQIAVEAAFALARRSDGHVHLVHVLTPMPSYQLALSGVHLAEIVEEERRAAASKLEAMAPRGAPFTCSTLYGFPSRELALAIESTKSDLVVIATHAHGVIRRALLGSVASALVRTSKVPVLVVGDARRSVEFRSVVAGVDLSPATRDVVELARSFVHPDGQVEIVSVVETAMLAAAGVTSPVLRAELDRLIDARKGAIREIVPHDAGPVSYTHLTLPTNREV